MEVRITEHLNGRRPKIDPGVLSYTSGRRTPATEGTLKLSQFPIERIGLIL